MIDTQDAMTKKDFEKLLIDTVEGIDKKNSEAHKVALDEAAEVSAKSFEALTKEMVGIKTQVDTMMIAREASEKALKDRQITPEQLIQQVQTNAGGVKRVSQHPLTRRIGGLLKGLLIARTQGRDCAIGYAKSFDALHGGDWATKTMLRTDFNNGGSLIPPDFATDIIEALHEMAVLRDLGARVIDMPSGSFTWPRLVGGATASYHGEGVATNATTETSAAMVLMAKLLISIVPCSMSWLRSGDVSNGLSDMIAEDLVTTMAETEDAYMIRGQGAPTAPLGIRWQALTANVKARTQAGAASTLAEITNDLGKLQYLVRNQKVRKIRPAYMWAPRTTWWLSCIQNAFGSLAFGLEMAQGTLMGAPYRDTTSIPITLSTDESEVIFAEMSQIVIGDAQRIAAEYVPNAAYVNSSGSVVAGLSQDVAVIKAISEHDVGLRQAGAEVSVLTTVDWGA